MTVLLTILLVLCLGFGRSAVNDDKQAMSNMDEIDNMNQYTEDTTVNMNEVPSDDNAKMSTTQDENDSDVTALMKQQTESDDTEDVLTDDNQAVIAAAAISSDLDRNHNRYELWGVNRYRHIYIGRFRGVSLAWSRVPGLLIDVSVARDGTVWGVNHNHRIYRYLRNRNTWQLMPGRLREISVGSKKHIWGITSHRRIYAWQGNNWRRIPGVLVQLSVNRFGEVWGVNQYQNIYYRKGINGHWVHVPGKLTYVSIGDDGTVWGCNRHHYIYQYLRGRNSWRLMPGRAVKVAVADRNHVYVVNGHGHIYAYLPSTNTYKLLPGVLRQLSASQSRIPGGGKLLLNRPLPYSLYSKECVGSGDPHWRTFNGMKHQAQGIGYFYVVKNCNGQPSLRFTIQVLNSHFGNVAHDVSVIRGARLTVPGLNVRVGPYSAAKITVNGKPRSVPNGGQRVFRSRRNRRKYRIIVKRFGVWTVVQIYIGKRLVAQVRYANGQIRVQVLLSLVGRSCGMCDNALRLCNNRRLNPQFTAPFSFNPRSRSRIYGAMLEQSWAVGVQCTLRGAPPTIPKGGGRSSNKACLRTRRLYRRACAVVYHKYCSCRNKSRRPANRKRFIQQCSSDATIIAGCRYRSYGYQANAKVYREKVKECRDACRVY